MNLNTSLTREQKNNSISFKKFLIKNTASFDDTLLRDVKNNTEIKKLTRQLTRIKHDLSVTYSFECGSKENDWTPYYRLLFEDNSFFYDTRTFLGDTLTVLWSLEINY